jgi:predicted Zn-dependent peptidase
MFEATTNIPRASIDKYVQEAGGDLNAILLSTKLFYYLRLPSNEIKLALWIESERMRGLLLEPVGVETQRGVVIEELKMRRNNQPYGTLLDEICNALFPEVLTMDYSGFRGTPSPCFNRRFS